MSRLFTSIWLAFLITIGASQAAAQPVISEVQIAYDGDETTRVVIHANKKLDYTEHALIGGGLRYVLDFNRVEWAISDAGNVQGEGRGVGGIQRYRYAHFSPETSRMVFDLDEPLIIESAFSVPPDENVRSWRMVIDFARSDIETFRKLKPKLPVAEDASADGEGQATTEIPASAEEVVMAEPVNPIIVIDPGHGGRDPGAIGPRLGVQEKDVNLNAALKLQKSLIDSGNYTVIMTRSTDTLVDYEERIRIAREANADLFISIHADAAGNRNVEGASVYTLSEKGDRRLASKLNEGDWDMPLEVDAIYDDGPDGEVEDILVSLMTRETVTHSSEFAEILIPELETAGPILRNTHRQANFYVLLSPNVPAVLLEVGFLTNRNDEKRLSTDKGITKSMRAVQRAIDIYFADQRHHHSQRQASQPVTRAG